MKKELEKTEILETINKKWYKSKTIIFNMFLAIFTGLGTLVGDSSFKEMVGDSFSYILSVVTIVNVYLRTVTDKALEK